jgi:hypothetical protein
MTTETILAALADRLACGDSSFAQAKELRSAIVLTDGRFSFALRISAALTYLFPPLAVPLARRIVGPRRTLKGQTNLSPPLMASARATLVITPSADFTLTAQSFADFAAPPVLILVGSTQNDFSLHALLQAAQPSISRMAFKAAATVEVAAQFIESQDGPTGLVLFHGLDRDQAQAFISKISAPLVEVNMRPQDATDFIEPTVNEGDMWSAENLSVVVRKWETQPVWQSFSAFDQLNRFLRTPPTVGRSYLRLSAGADLAECHRALDCLVAMRHVWIVSVDPLSDPYLIERVAKDAAFCEVQTADVFAEFIQAHDRIRVVGVPPSFVRAAGHRGKFFCEPVSLKPNAELSPYYLRQVLRVGHRGFIRAADFADVACASVGR